MAKTSGIGSGLDDLAKLIAKVMKSKPQQKVRYNFAKNAGALGTKSPKSAYPKKTKVGRIAKTAPPKKTYDKYPKDKSIPQTPSEQRAAERMANRMLRTGGSKGAGPSGGKPVDVKGSIISPPSKASLRAPKPSNKSYEADPTRRFETPPKKAKKAPKKGNQSKGTKPSQGTKKSKTGSTGGSSVKPKGNMSVGQGKSTVARDQKARGAQEQTRAIDDAIRGNRTQQNAAKLRDLNDKVNNAKTPAKKRAAIAQRDAFIKQMMNRK